MRQLAAALVAAPSSSNSRSGTRPAGCSPKTSTGARRRPGGYRALNELPPAYAGDNFVSLLPGERRLLTIESPAAVGRARVELKGWSLRATSAEVRAGE